MMSRESIYDNCYFLINIPLSADRVFQILQRRFRSNDHQVSFDFKSFRPEQPSNNTKVSRSLLRFNPSIESHPDEEETISSSDSSSDDNDEDTEQEEVLSTNDDNYLNELADWEPENFQPIPELEENEENDDDDVNRLRIPSIDSTENNQESHAEQLPTPEQMSMNDSDDLVVTYEHIPMKNEPVVRPNFDCFSIVQLDGQVDMSPSPTPRQGQRLNSDQLLSDAIARVKARLVSRKQVIQLNTIPSLRNRCLMNDERKAKAAPAPPPPPPQAAAPPKKIVSTPIKSNANKEVVAKEPKKAKKAKPPLLPALLKHNKQTNRPLYARYQSLQKSIEETSRTVAKQHFKPQSISRSNERNSSTEIASSSLQRTHSTSSNSTSKPQMQHEKSLSTSRDPSKNVKQKQKLVKKVPSVKTPSKSISIEKKQKEVLKPNKSIDVLLQQMDSKPKFTQARQDIKKKAKKIKRLHNEEVARHRTTPKSTSTPKKTKPIEHQIVKKQSTNNLPVEAVPSTPTGCRPAHFFDDCIVLDDDEDVQVMDAAPSLTLADDDIQEIGRQRCSIVYNIGIRGQLLDHTIRSSPMRIKWLFNLEYLLLEHILICHEQNIRPNDRFYPRTTIAVKSEGSPSSSSTSLSTIPSSYHVDPSLVRIIMLNFIKLFILRNSLSDQQEYSFVQFGLTSHLRYFLIELPTFNHSDRFQNDDQCSQCVQYSLIIKELLDLLFDVVEYDICEIHRRTAYRSSLIEDDYFHQFVQSKSARKSSSSRIKVIVYAIELIALHMSKCSQRKQSLFTGNETLLFQSLEDFLRHLLQQTTGNVNERLSICFNVMELCLLLVPNKELRVKQMSDFIVKLCEENLNHFTTILFNSHLLADIRLLVVNEMINKRFQKKLKTKIQLNEFFVQIQIVFNASISVDEFVLVLVQSLFHSYADLIIDIKDSPLLYTSIVRHLTYALGNDLRLIFDQLLALSSKNLLDVRRLTRYIILFRLLKCKWNQF